MIALIPVGLLLVAAMLAAVIVRLSNPSRQGGSVT